MRLRRFILLIGLCFSALTARADEVLIFAAASLKDPLDAIAAAHGGITVSYAGSGTIARQVLAGAPADIVFLANQAWMDELIRAGRVPTAQTVLSNRLVLIGPAPADPIALTPDVVGRALGDGRMAIGMTRSVPAGIYGQEALTSLGLWDALRPRLAEVDNVRAALALVARGEAPLGLVYATDARASDAVSVVARIAPERHSDIVYSVGAVAGQDSAAVQAVLTHLATDAAGTFRAAGFLIPEGAE